jgi:hypothetical protein
LLCINEILSQPRDGDAHKQATKQVSAWYMEVENLKNRHHCTELSPSKDGWIKWL